MVFPELRRGLIVRFRAEPLRGEDIMNLTTLAWLAMAAYTIHILEEYMLDWRNWARAIIGLPVEWSDFYVTNGVVVGLGIAQAMLAPTLPLAPLIYASLMLINAVFFHVLPVIWTKGRFSPGVVTAIVLMVPAATAVWRRAAADGALDFATGATAVIGGAALMASPIVMLRIKSKPYFRQDK
jgi:Protein of unknown function with HXXEE motif